jgi:hypothetical protein
VTSEASPPLPSLPIEEPSDMKARLSQLRVPSPSSNGSREPSPTLEEGQGNLKRKPSLVQESVVNPPPRTSSEKVGKPVMVSQEEEVKERPQRMEIASSSDKNLPAEPLKRKTLLIPPLQISIASTGPSLSDSVLKAGQPESKESTNLQKVAKAETSPSSLPPPPPSKDELSASSPVSASRLKGGRALPEKFKYSPSSPPTDL